LNFKRRPFHRERVRSTIEEYADVRAVRHSRRCDGDQHLVPNVKEVAWRFGNYPDMSHASSRLAARSRRSADTKLSPNQTDIARNARAVSTPAPTRSRPFNTLMGMAVDVETRQQIIGNVQAAVRACEHEARARRLRLESHPVP